MRVVLSLSGGMDSSSLLLSLLSTGAKVTALGFDYGQKHRVELERAEALVQYLQSKGKDVTFDVIKIDGIAPLLDSTLIAGNRDVPEGHYEQENMKDTVVPNRNKIFASLIQAVALSISTREDCEVHIAMGIHAGDHAIYPDCRQEFRDADFEAFQVGNWGSERVKILTPFLELDKYTILGSAVVSCEILDVDFDTVFALTNTSYKPMMIDGVWYSDYKSASSVERVEAFLRLGYVDPVQYADETGPVSWDVVANHVERVVEEQILQR